MSVQNDKRMLGMLDELLNDESDAMTAWEVEFIESLNKSRDRKWTDKQLAVLKKVWGKVFIPF